jgi:hypothetical protein
MQSGVAKLHVGDKVVDLDKVTKVATDEASLPASDAATEETADTAADSEVQGA